METSRLSIGMIYHITNKKVGKMIKKSLPDWQKYLNYQWCIFKTHLTKQRSNEKIGNSLSCDSSSIYCSQLYCVCTRVSDTYNCKKLEPSGMAPMLPTCNIKSGGAWKPVQVPARQHNMHVAARGSSAAQLPHKLSSGPQS